MFAGKQVEQQAVVRLAIDIVALPLPADETKAQPLDAPQRRIALDRPGIDDVQAEFPELAALVITFREAGFTRQQRLAILYRHDVHGGIRNFAFIGRMRGLQVQAFNEFEAALQWLSEVPVRPVAHPKQGVPIPITTRAAGVRKPQANLIAESPGGSPITDDDIPF